MKCKLASIVLAALLSLIISPAYATVYQGSATYTGVYPTLTLDVAIDTDADVWTATWHAASYLIDPPSLFYAFTIKFEDHQGFSREYSTWLGDDLSYAGTITIDGYTHTGTWTHTWVKWEYMFPLPVGFGLVILELWVNLYTGSTDSTGNGGGHMYLRMYAW